MEDGPINVELLHASVKLEEVRDGEDPFRQLAAAMMKDLLIGHPKGAPGSENKDG